MEIDVEPYMPAVRSLAKRLHWRIRRRVELEDLISVGYIALIKASRTFEESRGACVKTWITYRVNGALIDYLREIDPLTRNHRKAVGTSFSASQQFADEDAETGLKLSEVTSPAMNQFEYVLGNEAKEKLESYPTDSRYRRVLKLHFLEMLPQREVADLEGVSEGRISQIIKAETKKLQQYCRCA